MYDVSDDRYCYKGTQVLKNIPGHRDQGDLDLFEIAITTQRASEPLPTGRLDIRHFKAIHHHLFQDVYRWAGRARLVRIGKGGSMFCFPENIEAELKRLFFGLQARNFLHGRSQDDFVRAAAHFLAELNAIHAFRDGNGRAQMSFLALLATEARHPLQLRRLKPRPFVKAMVASFLGDERPLQDQLRQLVR